jgi:arylsulfatase A-like enzyme
MKVRGVIGALVACGLVAAGWFGFRQYVASRRPSIVLVIIDTLRADKLGIYGSPAPASAEFDELARQGIVFERAISQASWTRSSVASFLTGLYPRRAGVVKEKWDPLPSDRLQLAEILSDAGYETVGLTANPQLNKDFGFHEGFGTYVESRILFPWMPKQEGKVKAQPIRPATDILTEARRLVEAKRAGGKPIYLQVLLMDVHAHHRISVDEVDTDLKTFPEPSYLQAVRNATRPLAAFMKEVDQLLSGNVVFAVVSDHGEGLSDHPSIENARGHGNILYRSQIHVPLILLEGSEAGRFGAKRVSYVTELVDLVPTLLERVDIPAPNGIDGASRIAACQGKASDGSGMAFSETQWRPRVSKVAVTDGEFLYVEASDSWGGTAPQELQPFSGVQDGALTNLAERRAGDVSRFQEALAAAIGR